MTDADDFGNQVTGSILREEEPEEYVCTECGAVAHGEHEWIAFNFGWSGPWGALKMLCGACRGAPPVKLVN